MTLNAEGLVNYLVDEESLEPGQIDNGTALFSTGILDSFAMVSLVTFVEKSCGVRVKATEVTLENFDSIERILKFIEVRNMS